jgi:hypothetical protein
MRRAEAYGLSRSDLDRLLQTDRCDICETTDWGAKGSQIDHCHDGGHIRGVLCNNCNQGLGRFRDDPALLRAAAEYLEREAL